jgi:hypothetical protein
MMDAYVFGVSCLDRNDEYFPDGSEQFSLHINLPRGPEWDVLFAAMRERKPLRITLAQ